MDSLKTVFVLGLALVILGSGVASAGPPGATKGQVDRFLGQAGRADCEPGQETQALLQCLDSQDRSIRRKAAYLLGELGHSQAVPRLVDSLQDRDRHVRRIAVCALGKLQDGRAVESLVRILLDLTRSTYIRCAAAQSLRKINTPEARAALVRIASCDLSLGVEADHLYLSSLSR